MALRGLLAIRRRLMNERRVSWPSVATAPTGRIEGIFSGMSGTTGRIGGGGDLDEAVAVARELVSRLASDLEFREWDSGRAAVTLREAGDALTRLSFPTDAGAHISEGADANVSPIVLDVSDLLGYFENNRLPTGIQRVQAELIAAVLQHDGGQTAQLCCFVEGRDQWVRVDSARFLAICALSRSGGDTLDPTWVDAVRELRAGIVGGRAMTFPMNAMLVNVGSSWWVPNYFLYVRQAKITSNVRYVPLIYDLIPALTPENCSPNLVAEFVGWFIGVLDHADFYLAISQATRRDMISFSNKAGRPIPPTRIAVVPLDADFRSAEKQTLPSARRFLEPFVMFVSTLEARKNQMGALDAWAMLIARHGAARVPRLVLVGKQGYQYDLIRQRLETNADLRERVTILSGIEDVELQALYRDSLFTIYPSFYEGWGLPVTESLCYGKVPLVADNSSLPEAGGSLAVYYKTGSTVAMTAMLERLIFDVGFRAEREQIIRDSFRPRSWEDIGRGVAEQMLQWMTNPMSAWQSPVVQVDSYYPMMRQASGRVWAGMGTAEQFRVGYGWYNIEEGGCWTKSRGGELALRLPESNVERVGFELTYPGVGHGTYRIEVLGHSQIMVGPISGGPSKWAFLDLPPDVQGGTLHIRLSITFVSQPHTADPRDLGIGLRGFFVFSDQQDSRINFLEAVALGGLPELNFYRDRAPGIEGAGVALK